MSPSVARNLPKHEDWLSDGGPHLPAWDAVLFVASHTPSCPCAVREHRPGSCQLVASPVPKAFPASSRTGDRHSRASRPGELLYRRGQNLTGIVGLYRSVQPRERYGNGDLSVLARNPPPTPALKTNGDHRK